MEGKSAAGKVVKTNLLLPERTTALCSSSANSKIEPSLKERQISANFLAGTVIVPACITVSRLTRQVSSTSKSKPVRINSCPLISKRKCESIGKV